MDSIHLCIDCAFYKGEEGNDGSELRIECPISGSVSSFACKGKIL